MSFLMPSQRGFEHSPQQDLPELSPTIQTPHNRVHMPAASFQGYGSQSVPPSSAPPPPPMPSATLPYPTHDANGQELPKVGQTRCYWALLSSDLHFIYLDPVLASHLEEQAETLVGKSLLSFVHPDEQASAKHDLGGVLESRTLHGSVTRVRYSRRSRIRRQLGYQGTDTTWQDAEKIVLDSNYMAVDIVINWAAEGLVLCFIHAVVDLAPNDNDEVNKTGWTNWCGTPPMAPDQLELVFQRLLVCIPQTGTMSRVFQILSNEPDRQLLMSWPPDPAGQGPAHNGRDFAKLVEQVQIGKPIANGNDAKTSCTRRYKAQQDMAGMGEVESIFIPHGSVIFACHKVSGHSRDTGPSNATIHQLGYNSSAYGHPQGQQFYEQGSPYPVPPLPQPSSPNYHYLQHHHHQPPHWAPAGESSSHHPHYGQWNSPSPAHSISSLPSSVSNMRSGSFPPHHQHQWGPQGAPYIDPPTSASGYQRPISPPYGYSATRSEGSPTPTGDVVPPPRRRVSPGATRDQYGPGGRGAGNRPVGVLKCSSCKATQSPEWRKGPSGKKELCNACGLRYARSRAKKEGHTVSTNRRRKDKSLAKQEPTTPPAPSAPPYSSLRRSTYDDTSFMSTSSAGSGSGSEVYSGPPPAPDGLTPSPPPPSSNMNFVHYSHSLRTHGDSRQPFSNNSTSFYSGPSPLSNSPVLSSNTQSRLDHMPQYTSRLSPIVSSASPVSHSPLTTTTTPASFERDREKGRQTSPTTVSRP